MYKNLRTNLPRELMSCALAHHMRRLTGASAGHCHTYRAQAVLMDSETHAVQMSS